MSKSIKVDEDSTHLIEPYEWDGFYWYSNPFTGGKEGPFLSYDEADKAIDQWLKYHPFI